MLEKITTNYADKNWQYILKEHIEKNRNKPNKTYFYISNTINLDSINNSILSINKPEY